MDLPQDRSARPAADRSCDPCAYPQARPGEPALGLRPDRGRTCKAVDCTGSSDKVEFSYDGEDHRTQAKEYTAGSLTATRDFRYQGHAIVEESTNGTVSRGYVVDETGRILKVCDPSCVSPTTSYLVAWNGHGDALGLWRMNGDGTLTLANSYTYSSWGTPTTTVAAGFSDLEFRFLYVGSAGVQWDDFSGLGLLYMHARHYSPSLGRFIQPDPPAAEANLYQYAGSNPITSSDPTGMFAFRRVFARIRYSSRGHVRVRYQTVLLSVRRVRHVRGRYYNDSGCGAGTWFGIIVLGFGGSTVATAGGLFGMTTAPESFGIGGWLGFGSWNFGMAGYAWSFGQASDCLSNGHGF